MEYYPFDSRKKLYKSHIGAVAEDQTLRLRLLLHNDAKVKACYLVIRRDDEYEATEILLTKGENLDDYSFYECEFSLETGLYWYSFRYTSDYGEYYVTKTDTSLGIVSNNGGWWQQTVYDKDYTTPDWLNGGIIYQIFPDRFYYSGKVKKNVPDDRYIVDDWSKQPEHKQNCGKCELGNDYYCGDLKGITEKLPYLKSLGVNIIYLNPIFEAHSNHRYNTADYMAIDSLLGDEKDFMLLCEKAHKSEIKIILDGVFSHTGEDSRYFNKNGRYDTLGAYNSPDSPYRYWFDFKSYPDDVKTWWDVKGLPETIENNPDFTEFITGENGVLRHWLRLGADGWRLDVADELPDEFLDKIRTAIKTENPNAYILGEVWEDASNKISYNKRRRFLLGKQLDSVMNYPFADAIVDFIKNRNSNKLVNTVLNITENYPQASVNCLMNHLGTHDTMRIITRLGSKNPDIKERSVQSVTHLSKEEYQYGLKLLRLAAVIQYTLPGIPSLYYGDEIGLEGYGDPFCRGAFDWSKTDSPLTKFYKTLGKIRNSACVFKNGEFIPLKAEDGFLVYERRTDNSLSLTAVNCTDKSIEFTLPADYNKHKTNLDGSIKNSKLYLPPFSAEILI
ncbi:MAG: glycoside hydrolase family 13 protein [Ruminococcaceae bacterium]|nr:glycoside hydrolase family 13 protein [Oscillospiraceae bacterium]